MADLLHNLPEEPDHICPKVPRNNLKPYYQGVTGLVNWLAIMSRPDVSYSAFTLGQYNAAPRVKHLLAAKRVLRYLAGSIDLWLMFNGDALAELIELVPVALDCAAFTDADWATDASDRRSVSGYAIYMFGSLISWSANKQRAVALSSTESEYMAMTHLMKELLWCQVYSATVNFIIPCPFPLISDSQSALNIANADSTSKNLKHIDIRFHFIRSHIEDGSFAAYWIRTSDMVANIFTKPLKHKLFTRHRARLGLVPGSSISA